MTEPLGDRPLRIAFAGAGMRTGARFPTDRLDNLETLKLMESSHMAAGVR